MSPVLQGDKASYLLDDQLSPKGLFFFFWSYQTPSGISVPQTGIKPTSPVIEVQSPNHGTTRAIPGMGLFLPLFFTLFFQLWKPGLREVTNLR